MASQIFNMTSLWNCFHCLFLLPSLVTGPSFMSLSSLVLERWQLPFIRDWAEIQKSEIPPSEFCPKSQDWGELGIPNLTQKSLKKCYWMLQNARLTAFTVSELWRKTNGVGVVKLPWREHTSCRQLPSFTFPLNCGNTWSFHLSKVFLKNIKSTCMTWLLLNCYLSE